MFDHLSLTSSRALGLFERAVSDQEGVSIRRKGAALAYSDDQPMLCVQTGEEGEKQYPASKAKALIEQWISTQFSCPSEVQINNLRDPQHFEIAIFGISGGMAASIVKKLPSSTGAAYSVNLNSAPGEAGPSV